MSTSRLHCGKLPFKYGDRVQLTGTMEKGTVIAVDWCFYSETWYVKWLNDKGWEMVHRFTDLSRPPEGSDTAPDIPITPTPRYKDGQLVLVGDVVDDGHVPGIPSDSVVEFIESDNRVVKCNDGYDVFETVAKQYKLIRRGEKVTPEEQQTQKSVHTWCSTQSDDLGRVKAGRDKYVDLGFIDEYEAEPRSFTINKTRREVADEQRWRCDDYDLQREAPRGPCPRCGSTWGCMCPRPRTFYGAK